MKTDEEIDARPDAEGQTACERVRDMVLAEPHYDMRGEIAIEAGRVT